MKSAYTVIRKIVLSEKVTRGMEAHNRYCFRVDPRSNKIEIKHAIEQLYKVHVERVNTLIRRGKPKRERTMNYGRTGDIKRAIVTLKAGEKIEVV